MRLMNKNMGLMNKNDVSDPTPEGGGCQEPRC